MKATKQAYQCPRIEQVKLDNEISLLLNSAPPDGPEEGHNLVPEYFKNCHVKNLMA
jgi:hypothetical protein